MAPPANWPEPGKTLAEQPGTWPVGGSQSEESQVSELSQLFLNPQIWKAARIRNPGAMSVRVDFEELYHSPRKAPRLGWFKGNEPAPQQAAYGPQGGVRADRVSAAQASLPAELLLPSASLQPMAPPRFSRPSYPQQQPIPLPPPPLPVFAAPVQPAQEPVEDLIYLQELHAATPRRPRHHSTRKPCSTDTLQERAAWLQAPQPPPPLPAPLPPVPLLPLLAQLQTTALAAQTAGLGGLDIALLAQMTAQAQGLQTVLAPPPPPVRPVIAQVQAAQPRQVQALPEGPAQSADSCIKIAAQTPTLQAASDQQAPVSADADRSQQQQEGTAATASCQAQGTMECSEPINIILHHPTQANSKGSSPGAPCPSPVAAPAADLLPLKAQQELSDAVGHNSMQVDVASPSAAAQHAQQHFDHDGLVVKVCPPASSEASSQHSAATLRSCGSGLLDVDGDVAMGDSSHDHAQARSGNGPGSHAAPAPHSPVDPAGTGELLGSPVYPCASADDSPTQTPAPLEAQPAASVTCMAGVGLASGAAGAPCSPASPLSECDMMTGGDVCQCSGSD